MNHYKALVEIRFDSRTETEALRKLYDLHAQPKVNEVSVLKMVETKDAPAETKES